MNAKHPPDLRKKLRPLVEQVVEKLLVDAVTRIVEHVSARFESALGVTQPAPADEARAPTQAKRPRAQAKRKVVHRDVKPANVRAAVAPAPKRGIPVGGQVKCKVCGELGHNARRHKGDAPAKQRTPDAPAPSISARTQVPSAPFTFGEGQTASQRRRAEILARTAAARTGAA